MQQDHGASADADRATHEPNSQAISAVPVGIPSAESIAAYWRDPHWLSGDGLARLTEAVGSIVSMCADASDVFPDYKMRFEAVTEAVNELYGCIEDGVFSAPPATAFSFAWEAGTTAADRALALVRSMNAVKCKHKYPVGVIGAEARAHYDEARNIVRVLAASGIEARSDETAQQAQPAGREPGGKAETPTP